MTEIKNKTVGQYLKEIRENRDISLRSISQRTKIGLTLLEYLENNDLEQLPNKIYVIGFVKSYAKLLNISEKEALEYLHHTYDDESSAPKEHRKQTPAEHISQNEKNEKTTANKKNLLLTIISITVLIIVGTIFIVNAPHSTKPEIIKKINTKPTKIMPQTLSEQTPLKRKIPQAKQKTLPSETKELTEKIAEIKQVKPIAKPIATPKPLPTPTPTPSKEKKEITEDKAKKVKFYRIPQPMFSEIAASDALTLLPKHLQTAPAAGSQNLYIVATNGNTWITYKKDNQPIKKFTLSSGKSLYIQGQLIRIKFGNISGVKLFYNGKAIKLISKTNVKSLVFPPIQATNFKIPLFIFDNKKGTATPSDEYIKKNLTD